MKLALKRDHSGNGKRPRDARRWDALARRLDQQGKHKAAEAARAHALRIEVERSTGL